MLDALTWAADFRRRLPTTDLYFLNPLHYAGRKDFGGNSPKIRPIARNCYSVGAAIVVSRYVDAATLARIERFDGPVVYIADDDFAAGGRDPRLPEGYRTRLGAFAAAEWPRIRARADIVIVPNEVLAAAYGAKARILQPAWHAAPAGQSHFDSSALFEIALLGTGSHGGDVREMLGILAGILDRHPHARLTMFSAGEGPALPPGRQVRRKPPMAWWRYRRWLPRQRFHLALYPLAASDFNRARSANKFFEHAVSGAAGLMSPIPALEAAAGAELADILVRGGTEEWRARIEADIADPAACRNRAERTRRRIAALDPLAHDAAAWADIV